MKRSSSNTYTNEKPAKQTDGGKRWVLGTWLNRLSQYVQHKNADGNEPPKSDGGSLTNSAASVQNDTSNSAVREHCVSRADQDSVGNGFLVRPPLNRTGVLSLKRSSTFSSTDAARRTSVVNSNGDMSSQQARTPLVRRFTRDSSMNSGNSESGLQTCSPGNCYPRTSHYPTSQVQFAGVGIMPSVKLAQFGDRRLPTLGAHNSLMSGHNSVRIKIAPPDATRSPMSDQRVGIPNQSSYDSPAGSRDLVASALGENRSLRKRLYSDDTSVTDKHDNQAKKRRSNAEEVNTSTVNNQMSQETLSAVYSTNQAVSNANSITIASKSNKFGARNPIDVSYLSSRQVHKQGQDDRSTLASPDGSLPISRSSSISGRFIGSQIRLHDDGRISAGNSESPFASAPSSGRNTPAPSMDGLKSDFGTLVPSFLDATRQDVTPEKHRQLLLIKDGNSKRRLAPMSSDIASSFQLMNESRRQTASSELGNHFAAVESVKRKHSLSAKDYDKDRRMEVEQARLLLRDVTAGLSERRGSNQFLSTSSLVHNIASASQSAPAIGLANTSVSQSVMSATTASTFLPAFGSLQNTTSGSTTLSALPAAIVSSASSEQLSSKVPKEANGGFTLNATKSTSGETPTIASALSTTASASIGVTQPAANIFGFSSSPNLSLTSQPFTATQSTGPPLRSAVFSMANSQSLIVSVKANESSSDQNSVVSPVTSLKSLQSVSTPVIAFNVGSLKSSSTASNQFGTTGFGNAINSLGLPAVTQSTNASTGFSFGSVTSSSGIGSAVGNLSTPLLNSSAPPKSTGVTSTFSDMPTLMSSLFGSSLPSTVSGASSIQATSQPSFCVLNNASSASSGFGNSTGNPMLPSFGGIHAQTSTSGANHTTQFTPVFGSCTSNPQQPSTASIVLGVSKTSGIPIGASTFGSAATTITDGFSTGATSVSLSFGTNVTLSSGVFGNTNNNSGSSVVGFGSSSTPSLGFNSSVSSLRSSGFGSFNSVASAPMSSSFQSSSAVNSAFGQSAVNGLTNQHAAAPSFVFSGNAAEKSLNPPGNGFTFGSSAPTLGSGLAETTNGIGFQASSGGFKFGGSGDGLAFGGTASVTPVFGASNGMPSATPFGTPLMMPGFSSPPTQGGAGAFTIGSAGRSGLTANKRVVQRQRAGRR